MLSELGLQNAWRERHADAKCYSCHSASHGGLSRIDLGLGNNTLFPYVVDSAYEPRLLSDHSPFWVSLTTMDSPIRPLWEVTPFWLTLFPDPDTIPKALLEFL